MRENAERAPVPEGEIRLVEESLTRAIREGVLNPLSFVIPAIHTDRGGRDCRESGRAGVEEGENAASDTDGGFPSAPGIRIGSGFRRILPHWSAPTPE